MTKRMRTGIREPETGTRDSGLGIRETVEAMAGDCGSFGSLETGLVNLLRIFISPCIFINFVYRRGRFQTCPHKTCPYQPRLLSTPCIYLRHVDRAGYEPAPTGPPTPGPAFNRIPDPESRVPKRFQPTPHLVLAKNAPAPPAPVLPCRGRRGGPGRPPAPSV